MKENEIIERLYSLFDARSALLYWLDESTTGRVPMVKDEGIYPSKLDNSVATIRRLLPLMRQSMILMRGTEAYSVIAETLAGESSISHIIGAAVARDILGAFRSSTTLLKDYSKSELGRPVYTVLEAVEALEVQDHDLIDDQAVKSNDRLVEKTLLNAIVEAHEPILLSSGIVVAVSIDRVPFPFLVPGL